MRHGHQWISKRLLHLHEWQGKALLQKFGLPVQRFQCVTGDTVDTADIDAVLHWPLVVVKAQCEAGGRGKGRFMQSNLRGIELLVNPTRTELLDTARAMLTDRLVTEQTGTDGVPISSVMLAEGVPDTGHERYVAVVLDRASRDVLLLASPRGGMLVEDCARDVVRIPVTASMDFAEIGRHLEVPADLCADFVSRLVCAFASHDATLIEVNPLSFHNNRLLAIDAKVTIDDNALFRHSEYVGGGGGQGNYIRLDGLQRQVGCMVNGAGLAMATMDLLGPAAANFLDIGGGATAEDIKHSLLHIASDPRVHTVLVNVFGGIVRCDHVAMGVRAALSEAAFGAQVQRTIVRLTGNNAQAGLGWLKGLPGVHPCSGLLEAAHLALAPLQCRTASRGEKRLG